jgi:hypothetical protein
LKVTQCGGLLAGAKTLVASSRQRKPTDRRSLIAEDNRLSSEAIKNGMDDAAIVMKAAARQSNHSLYRLRRVSNSRVLADKTFFDFALSGVHGRNEFCARFGAAGGG